MPTPLEIKKGLEDNIKNSYVNSGGMDVVHCSIDIDKIGLIKVSIAINPGSLPIEGVEALVHKTFGSVGVAAYVKQGKWDDIIIDSSSSSVVKVEAYGYK